MSLPHQLVNDLTFVTTFLSISACLTQSTYIANSWVTNQETK